MMRRTALFLPVAAVIFVTPVFSQPFGPQKGEEGRGPERIEKYKKFRMIEALDLNEEEAVRLVAKYNLHKDNMRELVKQRMETVDRLEELIKSNGEENALKQQFVLIEESEQEMFDERKRFQQEVSRSLSTEQFAKFLVFDRNFNRELRRAMEHIRREGRRR